MPDLSIFRRYPTVDQGVTILAGHRCPWSLYCGDCGFVLELSSDDPAGTDLSYAMTTMEALDWMEQSGRLLSTKSRNQGQSGRH